MVESIFEYREDFADRLNNPLFLIRMIAKKVPFVITYSSSFWATCGFCNTHFISRESAEDEYMHDEDCEWRLCKELSDKLSLG